MKNKEKKKEKIKLDVMPYILNNNKNQGIKQFKIYAKRERGSKKYKIAKGIDINFEQTPPIDYFVLQC